MRVVIPTEPIGSIPRPPDLIDAVEREGSDNPALDPQCDAAIRETIERFEATGSPDGGQRGGPAAGRLIAYGRA